jgi:hypothetical protein
LSELPLRATFTRDHWIAASALRGTTGLPIPLPVHRVVLELDENELRLLGRRGAVSEAWPRGALGARISPVGRDGFELKLRRPDGGRTTTLRATKSADALALAELLAQDTRIAAGTDLGAHEAVRRLAAETLPEKLRRRHADKLGAITALLAPGERPAAVAVATSGVALLTDRALCWWDGGRKDPVVIERGAIRFAAAAPDALLVDHDDGIERFEFLEPDGRAAEIAAALPPRAGLDELLASESDVEMLWEVRRAFAPLRARWRDGERGELFARADFQLRTGALVLTDLRLLWGSGKADPIVLERREVVRAETKRVLGIRSLELALPGGGELEFDDIAPRERLEKIRAVLPR